MTKNIKLVLSGSGCLYPVHVGAILRLVEAGYSFKEVCGTSGGAIVAAALATGYPANSELVKMVKKTLPANNGLIDFSITSLIFNWGLIKGHKIESVFSQYFVKNMSQTKIPLHIITTNIDQQTIRVFSTKTDPDILVAQAVRASMAMPGVFAPVRINDELHVDGGVMANFYLDFFGAGEDVVGLRFKSVNDIKTSIKVKSPIEYIQRVINSLIQSNDNERIEDAKLAKTIILESKYSSLKFNMTESDVDKMIEEGYHSADKWLRHKDI